MTKHHWVSGLLLLATALSARAQMEQGLALARDIAADNQHAQAAVEYRRLAMQSEQQTEQGALYWMAGYEYLQGERYMQADRMLRNVEDATSDLEAEVYLLRSQSSQARHRLREAAFYLEHLNTAEQPKPLRMLAAKRLAAVQMAQQDTAGARSVLREAQGPQLDDALSAIAAYEAGHDKRPLVGGLLGMIPGLGYAYSGEYASAMRSLMLNALCIWGLVEFAEEDQWGGVAVVGFAEITFYSGSIYGGADAAARYNERRLQEATRVIEGNTTARPDLKALPILTLRYTF
jgi:hypothetical protein